VEKKLQFAVMDETPLRSTKPSRPKSKRKSK